MDFAETSVSRQVRRALPASHAYVVAADKLRRAGRFRFGARRMTPEQLTRIRALLARGCFFPEARTLALTMLKIHERRNGR